MRMSYCHKTPNHIYVWGYVRIMGINARELLALTNDVLYIKDIISAQFALKNNIWFKI